MEVLNTVVPVFILIGVGTVLFRSFLDRAVLRGINWLTYWVGLPVLIFNSIARSDLAEPMALKVFFLVLAATVATLVAGSLFGRLLGVSSGALGTFLQAAFRGNLAFIGIPVVIFAYPDSETAGTLAILTLAPMMFVYNVLSVVVLQRSRDGGGAAPPTRRLLRALLTNPLIVASVAGGAFALSGYGLPFFVERSLGVLGEMAPGLALLSIGGALAVVELKGGIVPASAASLLKVGLCPLAGILLAPAFGLEGEALGVALILLAAPTAAASYILAQQLGGDEGLASGAIVISTVLSVVSLSLVVAFF